MEDWLKEVFAGSPIPDYEIDEEKIDKLYTIAQNFNEKEQQAKVLISDFEERSVQYEKEGL